MRLLNIYKFFSFLQMFHIPYLVPEMYLNYDCDIRCSNLLEDFAKVLSKVSSHLYLPMFCFALRKTPCRKGIIDRRSQPWFLKGRVKVYVSIWEKTWDILKGIQHNHLVSKEIKFCHRKVSWIPTF